MALRDSVWYPSSVTRGGVVLLVLLMTVAHQTELFGLMNAGLVFGWVPIQFAYDVVYSLVAVVFLYWVYTVAPDPPAEYRVASSADDETADVPARGVN